MNQVFFQQYPDAFNPPAIVREAEQAKYQRLVAQGREAAALEAEGKHANVEWVQALKAAYPDGLYNPHWKDRTCTHPKVYEIVIAVRGCTRPAAKKFLSTHKNQERFDRECERTGAIGAKNVTDARRIRRAAIELATKYRLGADPVACMEALANLIEGKHNA